METIMAMSRLPTPMPSAATNAMMSSMPGMHMMISKMRMMILSTRPPKYPHTAPISEPSTTEMTVDPMPMVMEILEP